MHPPPPPLPPPGGGGGVQQEACQVSRFTQKKSLLSEGFVLTISVGDQDRFRRRDQSASVLDHFIKRSPLKNQILSIVNRKDAGKEILLLARSRTELAGNRLLHAEPRLISTAARLMRIKIGDGRESVEEGLAVVTSTTLKQFGQSGYGVESPRRHSVGICTSPTSEKRASVNRSDGDFVGDLQSPLELSGHADKLVNGLFHVLNFRKEILGVADLEAELA